MGMDFAICVQIGFQDAFVEMLIESVFEEIM